MSGPDPESRPRSEPLEEVPPPDPPALEAPVGVEEGGIAARRTRLRGKAGGSLRSYTAGGMALNAVWAIGLQGLGFARGFVVAIFLAPSDYGIWSIIILGYSALGRLKQVGVADKYIQQDDPDEEVAFQKAFTLEAILTGTLIVLLALLTPFLAMIYRAPEIVGPGFVLLLALVGGILQTPIWAYARELDYKKQRRLSAVDPVIAVIVTIVSAVMGAGYWSFALGSVAGAWCGALVILRYAPYKLRFRYDRGTAREYVSFSWPLLVSNLSNTVLIQTTTLFARSAVGLAGLGAMSLSNSIRIYTEFANGIISSTMYPAVAAIKDKRELLYESFVKSNRLALMWGLPIGVGVAMFAADLLHYVFGDEWTYATMLFQMVGLVSASSHIAFNWGDYVRVLGDTRPIAKYAWLSLIGWGIGPLPLMLMYGLNGYAVGLGVVGVVTLTLRGYFVRKLFPGFGLMRHVVRAVLPTVPAVAAVFALRELDPFAAGWVGAVVELFVYLAVTAAATALFERRLLREAVGYLRQARGANVSPA